MWRRQRGVKDCRGQEARNQADAAASGPPSRCWRRPPSKAGSSISNPSFVSPHISVPKAAAPHGAAFPGVRCPRETTDSAEDGPISQLHRRPCPAAPVAGPPEAVSGRRQACGADPAGLTPSCISPAEPPTLPIISRTPGPRPPASTVHLPGATRPSPAPADKEPAQGTSGSS